MIPSASVCNLTSDVCCTALGWASDSGIPLHTKPCRVVVRAGAYHLKTQDDPNLGGEVEHLVQPQVVGTGSRQNDGSKSRTCDKERRPIL
jgi:hypothetical protein